VPVSLSGAVSFAATSAPATNPPPSDGLSWGTLVLAVIAAAFIGGYIGNRRASNRFRPPRISVYAVIEQRLHEGSQA
jgi:uncharacterized membrane protein YfcA